MTEEKKSKGKEAADNFLAIFKEFGDALAEMFDDPELKKKAREFGQSAVDSFKTFGDRFKDEEVRKRFRNVGEAAQRLGQNMADFFKVEKKSEQSRVPEEKEIIKESENNKPGY